MPQAAAVPIVKVNVLLRWGEGEGEISTGEVPCEGAGGHVSGAEIGPFREKEFQHRATQTNISSAIQRQVEN